MHVYLSAASSQPDLLIPWGIYLTGKRVDSKYTAGPAFFILFHMMWRQIVLVTFVFSLLCGSVAGRHVRQSKMSPDINTNGEDYEEEEESFADHITAIRDIIRAVGFSLKFGKDGLKIELGKGPEKQSSRKSETRKHQTVQINSDKVTNGPLIGRRSGVKDAIYISGRPYVLMPIPENYALLPLPVVGQSSPDPSLTTAAPVSPVTSVTEPAFSYPSLMPPAPVTESVNNK